MSALQPLIIIGAGGFARETADAIEAHNSISPTWNLIGFADDRSDLHGTSIRPDGTQVIGPAEVVLAHPEAAVVICTGNPNNYFTRRQIVERLALDEGRFATIVHPMASIGSSVEVGIGTVILAGAVATADVQIGKHVTVMPQVLVTHDDIIGDYCSLTGGVGIAGGCTIEQGAYIGAGSQIKGPITIGAWSLIGMGSLVLTDVPLAEVWTGAPAKKLRDVELPADF